LATLTPFPEELHDLSLEKVQRHEFAAEVVLDAKCSSYYIMQCERRFGGRDGKTTPDECPE
jgi:hypothetical protein